jgi:hypothetical protein
LAGRVATWPAGPTDRVEATLAARVYPIAPAEAQAQVWRTVRAEALGQVYPIAPGAPAPAIVSATGVPPHVPREAPRLAAAQEV